MNRSCVICVCAVLTACASTAPKPSPLSVEALNKSAVAVPPAPVMSLVFDAKCGVTQPSPIEKMSSENQKTVTPPKIDPRHPLTFPAYPPTSLRAGHAGTVYVSTLITETGAIGQVKLQRSSGFVELDNAAMENTRTWQLIPARFQDKPICMWSTMPVVFSIKESSNIDSKK